jgi:hypothetical protein
LLKIEQFLADRRRRWETRAIHEAKLMRRFWGDHWLTVVVAGLAIASFAAFTWAEYGYFCDQGRDHGNRGCEGFWSAAHLHDWIYNTASNWQSELFFGVLLVILLHKAKGGDA